MVSIRKIGGLWHWRIGRLGGSFYVAAGKAQGAAVARAVALPALPAICGQAEAGRRAKAALGPAERLARAKARTDAQARRCGRLAMALRSEAGSAVDW